MMDLFSASADIMISGGGGSADIHEAFLNTPADAEIEIAGGYSVRFVDISEYANATEYVSYNYNIESYGSGALLNSESDMILYAVGLMYNGEYLGILETRMATGKKRVKNYQAIDIWQSLDTYLQSDRIITWLDRVQLTLRYYNNYVYIIDSYNISQTTTIYNTDGTISDVSTTETTLSAPWTMTITPHQMQFPYIDKTEAQNHIFRFVNAIGDEWAKTQS